MFKVYMQSCLCYRWCKGPSEPINPKYPYDCKQELQDCKIFAQPLPVIKQPGKNFWQSALVESEFEAFSQAKGFHRDEPESLLIVHGPYEPIIPVQPTAC